MPTISAASATVARASTASSASGRSAEPVPPADVSARRRPAGSGRSSRAAGSRVRSSRDDAAAPSIAATMSTVAASGTKLLNGSAFSDPVPVGPGSATVAVCSPLSTAGSRSEPTASSTGAASTADAKNGPGAATYPSSSMNRQRSTVGPAPSSLNERRCSQSGAARRGRRCARARASSGTRARAARARTRAAAPARRSARSPSGARQPRGEPEHPLGDDVALDLARAAGDRVGEAHEDAEHPTAGVGAARRRRSPARTAPGSPCRARRAPCRARTTRASGTSARVPTIPGRTR